jgi:hypothetical protein
MAEPWDIEILYNTLIPASWFSGVVAKLRETSVTTVGFELDENGDLEPVA